MSLLSKYRQEENTIRARKTKVSNLVGGGGGGGSSIQTENVLVDWGRGRGGGEVAYEQKMYRSRYNKENKLANIAARDCIYTERKT